ncbi:MAG: Rrf2 family transcriptional regulator [Deltaproteobacteria bacterium]|nr:Rrf2 family transcriptional regulator [Deltaproteobacteria bacterium]
MRLSTKGQYAVRAMVNLACKEVDVPVSLKEISEEEGISLSYLEQLFIKLRRGDIVKSVRGPGGGYLLSRPCSRISVGEVITMVEEPLNPVACLDNDSKGYPTRKECDRAERCITQGIWKDLGDRIKGFLNSVSIEDLKKDAVVINNRIKKKKSLGTEACDVKEEAL